MPLLVPVSAPCPLFKAAARELAITFPGGAKIGPMVSDLYATEAELARALLGQVQVVLAPLKPVFDILAAVMAIVEILGAVPKVPSNPAKFLKAMADAAKKFAALTKLVPQLSGPIMLGHVLDVVISVLNGLLAEVDAVVVQQKRINSLSLKIIGEHDLLRDVLACATRINQMRMCAIDESLGPMRGLFDLLNLFLTMIGLPKLEALGPLGHDPFGARTALLGLVQALRLVRKGLPIPPLVAIKRC
jgi:hypothetical protein